MFIRSIAQLCILSGLLSGCGEHIAVSKTEAIVCADKQSGSENCDYFGAEGIQQAISEASEGKVILIRAGRYEFSKSQDWPFREYERDDHLDLTVRAAISIIGKNITLLAEDGVTITSLDGVSMSAMVVIDSNLRFSGGYFSGFQAENSEDEIYDGHGIFVINSEVDIENVTISGSPKMAIAGRGDSDIDVRNASLIDNHIGIWAEEASNLSLRNVLIKNSHVAGVAAYDDTTVKIYNSVIVKSEDDGLYAKGRAIISAFDSLLTLNAPYAARAVEYAQIFINYSALLANEEDTFADQTARVSINKRLSLTKQDPLKSTQKIQDTLFLPINGDPNGRSSKNGGGIGIVSVQK